MNSSPAGNIGTTRFSATDQTTLGGPYWRLWWANAINSVGDGTFLAALPLLAITVTTDPRHISYIAGAAFLPWLILSLPAGVIVDRYDRARLMWCCQAFQAAIVTAISISTVSGFVSVPSLVLASFLLGGAQVVVANAAQTALPQFVPAHLLHKANGNLYIAQTLGTSALGPPIGSLLFVLAAVLPFGLDAASFVLSAILLATLPRIHVKRPKRSAIWVEMYDGLSWLTQHKLLRTLAFMLGMNTFCYQMGFATLVLLATQTLHLSERNYGLLLVGGGIGSIIGGLITARITRRLGPILLLVVSYAGNAIIFIAIGLAPDGGVLAGLLAVCGFAVTVTNVVTVSLRQQIVPDHILGRVNSIYRMLGWGLMPFGSLVGGLAAHHIGLRAPFVGAGSIRAIVLVATLPVMIAGARSLNHAMHRCHER